MISSAQGLTRSSQVKPKVKIMKSLRCTFLRNVFFVVQDTTSLVRVKYFESRKSSDNFHMRYFIEFLGVNFMSFL